MMYRTNRSINSVSLFIAILLLNGYEAAGKNALFGAIAEPKTHCNCQLKAGKLADRISLDDIAVSFTVTIMDSSNSTSMGVNRRFVLVRKMRAEFLLALPDDSEILSLTTLKHSVQSSSVKMYPANDTNCFNRLDAICKDLVIVAAFYKNTEFNVEPGSPVCFPPLEGKNKTDDSDVVHRCCTWKENLNNGFVNCSQVIHPNDWVSYAIIAVQVVSAVLFLIAPLLFKYLPTRDSQIVRRSRVTGPKRLGYSNYLATPVDSLATNRKLLTLVEPLSFVTCGGDEAQACYSRLCRVIGLLIFPLIFCACVWVFLVDNNNTSIRSNVTYYTGLIGFLKQPVEYYVFAIVLFCIIVLSVLVLIPGRLSGLGRSLSGRKDEKTFLGFPKPEQYLNHHTGKTGFQFMQSNMVFHLKCCIDAGFWVFIMKIIFAPCTWLLTYCCCPGRSTTPEQSETVDFDQDYETPKICLVLGFILLPVIMALWIPFVIFCLVVYITPVGYVAFRICRLLYSQDIPLSSDCCERLPSCIRIVLVSFLYCMFILFCSSVLGSYVFLTSMFGVFFYILGKIFLYTLIGLGFNVKFFIPYTVSAFFVIFYIWRAFSHYISVYENLRIVLFEECEKYEQQEPMNIQPTSSASDSSSMTSTQAAGPGLLLLDNNYAPSIPFNLYVAVYRRLRPRGKTFFIIVMKLLLTLVYLSIAFAAIMSLNNAEDTSTYVQAVFLCATFALPLVLFHGNSSHSKKRRKDLEYQVRFIIHRYVSKLGSTSEPIDNTTVEAGGNVEFVQPGKNDLFDI
ncbi:uncharacterized protein LOC114524923 [Dendronephthya gigantea]|uniref:uncharacterized protein LOC114524923 n=1 Tax=Dendronephthya gigantea TaxID=151771 RepID=UPI00106C76B4|nr:uncharacterized protein LOC114524923 [Dendronephthya gigantea]